jgi:hypothetical protein
MGPGERRPVPHPGQGNGPPRVLDQRDDSPGGRQIRFNGAVEWALDAIQQKEVVWLPSESQLRDRLGASFRSLTADEEGYVCAVSFDGELNTYRADTPEDAYGLALLDLLREPDRHMSTILGEI